MKGLRFQNRQNQAAAAAAVEEGNKNDGNKTKTRNVPAARTERRCPACTAPQKRFSGAYPAYRVVVGGDGARVIDNGPCAQCDNNEMANLNVKRRVLRWAHNG